MDVQCQRCLAPTYRITRRLRDRLISVFLFPVHRRRCMDVLCAWEGVVRASAPRDTSDRGGAHYASYGGVLREPRLGATPDPSEFEMMQSLGITFEDGHYTIGGYRYRELSDAMHYAKLKAQGIA